MPLQRCKRGSQRGWKFGASGKCFFGPRALAKARAQERAIRASGWTENYSPDQPRVPAGSPEGGEWTGGTPGGGGGASSGVGVGDGGNTIGGARYSRLEGDEHIEKTLGGAEWTDSDKKTIRQYVGTSQSYKINNALRYKGSGTPTQYKKAEEIASVLDKHRFPADVQVARNIVLSTPEDRALVVGRFRDQIGKTFVDPAFVSTSANAKYAERWTGTSAAPSSITCDIRVPKGAKAAYISKGIDKKYQQWEVVIQRGSSFRVLSVKENHVTLELVP
jgi:hypothetical protein